jgi:tol-pal system-associated acyl-CoA thioesterase
MPSLESTGRGFVVRERVRWSDVDTMGILYFGAYVRFIELGETELFRALGFPYHEVWDRFDIWLARIHVAYDFLAPARLDDELAVTTRVVKVGQSSVRFAFELTAAANGRPTGRAALVVACVDRERLRPRRLPGELAAALRGCMGRRGA